MSAQRLCLHLSVYRGLPLLNFGKLQTCLHSLVCLESNCLLIAINSLLLQKMGSTFAVIISTYIPVLKYYSLQKPLFTVKPVVRLCATLQFEVA